MIPVETLPGIEGEGEKENGGSVNSSIIYLIYCKNSCKCHNVTPPSRTIIKKILQNIVLLCKLFQLV
jgi:hypothetical protein